MRTGWHRFQFPLACSARLRRGLAFVMRVRAAQEWHFVEHVLLEPFEPEINHRCDEKRDHLRKNQTADDDKAERTPRGGVLSKTESERHRAHQGSESGHHDGPKTL